MRVYYTPPTFGAGASQSQSLRDTTVIICHHGAGYTGLSFALFAKEVKERTRGESGVLSVDARLHGKSSKSYFWSNLSFLSQGKTKALDDNSDSNPEQDLSLDSLMEDAYALLTTTFPDPANAPSFLVRHFSYVTFNYQELILASLACWSQYGWRSTRPANPSTDSGKASCDRNCSP